jgi:hypothetical protein
MPVPAGTTSHAHIASPADPLHFTSDATVKQGGQSDHTVTYTS